MKTTLKIWLQSRALFALQLLIVVLITVTASSHDLNAQQYVMNGVQFYLSALLLEALFTSPQIGFHLGLLELLKGEQKRKIDIMVITIISTATLLYTSSCLMIFFFKKIAFLKPVLQDPIFYQLTAISIIISLTNILLQRQSIYTYCNTPINIDIRHFTK
ncbi:MAG: hypothetical protein R2800_01285 [Flavipsychrobacter sp.]